MPCGLNPGSRTKNTCKLKCIPKDLNLGVVIHSKQWITLDKCKLKMFLLKIQEALKAIIQEAGFIESYQFKAHDTFKGKNW